MSFPETHVDYSKDITFTQRQLMKRWDAEIERIWNTSTQNNLRDFKQVMEDLDPETFPNYAANAALLEQFTADKLLCYERRTIDEARSALLIATLEYERAKNNEAELLLAINGREADPEQGIPEVEPLSETIWIFVNGVEAEVPNPAKYDSEKGALARLQAAQDVVASASQDVVSLASVRASSVMT